MESLRETAKRAAVDWKLSLVAVCIPLRSTRPVRSVKHGYLCGGMLRRAGLVMGH